MEKNLIIEGDEIYNIASFYEEINRVFMPNEDWKIGESLDAFSDLLYGGFGEIKGNEPIKFIWRNIEKSKIALGLEITQAFYKDKLSNPGLYNVQWIQDKLNALEKGEGQTYYEIIIEILSAHPNIELLEK